MIDLVEAQRQTVSFVDGPNTSMGQALRRSQLCRILQMNFLFASKSY